MSPDTHKTLLRELRRLARRRGWTVPEWKFQRALVFVEAMRPVIGDDDRRRRMLERIAMGCGPRRPARDLPRRREHPPDNRLCLLRLRAPPFRQTGGPADLRRLSSGRARAGGAAQRAVVVMPFVA